MKRIYPIIFILSALVFGKGFTPPAALAQDGSRLVSARDLIYQGAFAFPAGDAWAYSGHALAYYPGGDPSGASDGYPGSLYAAGSKNNDTGDQVGEISIPAPVISDNFDALPRANVLQSLTDITGGWKDHCTYHDDCMYRDVDGLAYLSEVDKI
ncbi:MAG: hypothetical protein K9M96_17225, partial [Deltaproteobacteria bacterium]|nr:hypothetical protein [Deltaproteobacteria bacterium]